MKSRCAGVQARSVACGRLLVFNSVAALFLRFCEVWDVWCAVVLDVRVPLCLGVDVLARLRSPFRGVCCSCAQKGVRLNNVFVGFFRSIF